ncbi:MAG TPA: hypothetical protein VEX70_08900 [Pyrinomonadaceae bacterium]|jgi:hypothetical protein|nr:hypothetical protein [Pyrinomonadaceae bacterium]
MNNQEDQDSLAQKETGEQSTRSNTGDERWPRPDEAGNGAENASGNAGQKETGGTGGYGGTSGASGAGQAEN